MSDSLVLSLDSDTPVDSSQTAAATARKLETTLARAGGDVQVVVIPALSLLVLQSCHCRIFQF